MTKKRDTGQDKHIEANVDNYKQYMLDNEYFGLAVKYGDETLEEAIKAGRFVTLDEWKDYDKKNYYLIPNF